MPGSIHSDLGQMCTICRVPAVTINRLAGVVGATGLGVDVGVSVRVGLEVGVDLGLEVGVDPGLGVDV